jgi:hypothetical protein
MATSTLRFPVAVILRCAPLANRWASERWEAAAVLLEPARTASEATAFGDDGSGPRWRFGGHEIELHPSEAEGYWLIVSAPEPKVFVMWRAAEPGVVPPVHPVIVTVSYSQAARMLDGGEQVDAVPLPSGIRKWMQPFVAMHYQPEVRRKVRRNDPFRDDAERRAAVERATAPPEGESR